jgi:hypothetical protein
MDEAFSRQVASEVAEVTKRPKRPGETAFVGRAQANWPETVVLVGSRTLGWGRLVLCRHGDHRQRALGYAKQFNERSVS